jgi:HNH endonuclease
MRHPSWTPNQPSDVWKRVQIGEPDECWPWTGGKRAKGYGYGSITIAQRQYMTHRVAWETTYGPIPAGLFVLHRCDNAPCCNPAHLFLGTIADNNADANAKGLRTFHRGEAHHQAKLTNNQVISIRQRCADGESFGRLAAEFNVGRTAIRRIAIRHSWRHLPEQVAA